MLLMPCSNRPQTCIKVTQSNHCRDEPLHQIHKKSLHVCLCQPTQRQWRASSQTKTDRRRERYKREQTKYEHREQDSHTRTLTHSLIKLPSQKPQSNNRESVSASYLIHAKPFKQNIRGNRNINKTNFA